MRFARTFALSVCGAACGIAVGCLVELEHRLACGDGYVDDEAGEECDPNAPESFARACTQAQLGDGTAQCDPETCVIVVSLAICKACNDGVLAPGEDCDLSTDEECPNGGQARCTDCVVDLSQCHPWCGDGQVGLDEECDPEGGGFATTPSCTDRADGLALVPSPYGEGHLYGSGESRCDSENCRWERSNCSYCGNGQVDDGEPLRIDAHNDALIAPPEWCDGVGFSKVALEAYASEHGFECPLSQRPNVGCVAIGTPGACYGFVARDDGQSCCMLANELYPGDEAGLRCCWEYDHPGEQPWHTSGVNRLCN